MYYSNTNNIPRMRKNTPLFLIALYFLSSLSFVSCVSGEEKWTVASETKKMAADYRDKGLRYQQSGDMDTALIYFQKAVELDPTLAVGYNDIGVLYESKGWYDRAKQAYGRAIEIDPTLPSPYYNMGSIYEKEGDFDKAIYYYKQRVLIGDWNDEWTMKARQSLKGLGVNDPELKQNFLDEQMARMESSEDIKGEPKGNDLNPKRRKRDARLHLMRGKQLYSMGMFTEALKELSLASVLDPKSKEISKTLEEVQQKALFND
ncbi:MAG: tetratricopeptide repeat protein [Candidatus Omnitrophica bacterium]|nr:tetratricopeptide repeat protein [Candidatus Omnitrophota bacterium]